MDEIVRGYTGKYFPLCEKYKSAVVVPVRDDFAVNGRHGRQFWVHAQSGPNGLSYLSGKPDNQLLIGNNPDLPGCGAVSRIRSRLASSLPSGDAQAALGDLSESRNSRLLCGKCSTACEEVSPQASGYPLGAAPSRGGASADGQTTLVKRQ